MSFCTMASAARSTAWGSGGVMSLEPSATTTSSTCSSPNSARPELAVHGLRRPGRALPHLTHPLLGHRSQGAVHVPVALQHEEVVEVLGVEVGGAEHVVVAQDRAEAREEEVRAGEEEGHGVRRAAHVRLGDEGVVARARLEVAEHDEEVLGEQLAHAAGHGADHAGRVDAAVLHALGAHRPGERDAARLEVEHRLALGGAHERLRAAAARDPHLEAARGVGGAEKGLGPGRVVAVDEGALGAVHGDRLGVGGEAMEGELELHGLLDGALRERPAGADLRADEHGQRVGGRVAVHGHRGLDLAEAEGDRGGGVGGQQQRVVETVGDVRLAGRRAAHAHLADRHLQLDRAQQRDDARELGGGGAPGEADDVLPGRARVDDQAGERDVVEGVRLLGHRRVDAVRGDERVDEVEVGGRHAVQLSDAAGRVDLNGGLGIVRARERDEPRVVVLLGEAVEVDGARVEADEAAETRGLFVRPRHQPAAARGDGSGMPVRRTPQYGSASSSRHSHTCRYGSPR